MKKSIILILILLAAVLTACDKSPRYSKEECASGGVAKGYYELDIFLDVGETYAIDIAKLYKPSKIRIDDYELKCFDDGIATVNDNVVMGVENGKTNIYAKLYDRYKGVYYEALVACVYVIDEENMTPVTTAQELSDMRNNLYGHYILKNDIDLADWGEWDPIGKNIALTMGSHFTGIFVNRNEYVIKNLTLSVDTGGGSILEAGGLVESNGGLFGAFGGYADGIILENVRVYDHESSGGIAGSSGGIIANCRVSGAIKARDYGGGICGNQQAIQRDGQFDRGGRIINCELEGTVEVLSEIINPPDYIIYYSISAGGITGFNSGRIINCKFEGTVETYGEVISPKEHCEYMISAGGIAGVDDGLIINCIVNADIYSNYIADEIFGVAFSYYEYTHAINCHFNGTVEAPVLGKTVIRDLE